MNLFNDEELFETGIYAKKVYNLSDTELRLINCFIPKGKADFYYRSLLNNTLWREYSMEMYGKQVKAPRMIAWYEDIGNPQRDPLTPALTPELNEIRDAIAAETGMHFNSVLLNLYRNGNDGVAWHSDKEENFGKNAVIASVTFGQTRIFRMRHKFRKDIPVVEIPLQHGSFLLMAGTTQSYWEHQIPKTTKEQLPRINLTFRQVRRDN